jgi:hypothetical protein
MAKCSAIAAAAGGEASVEKICGAFGELRSPDSAVGILKKSLFFKLRERHSLTSCRYMF